MAKNNKNTQPVPMTDAFAFSMPQAPERKAEEYLNAYEGYPYSAINAISQDVASIDLHLFKVKYTNKGPETEEIYQHPAMSVLEYVNEFTTLYDHIEATQVYLELVGEAYWAILKDENGKGDPAEMWLLRPDWVKVIPSETEFIAGYTYHPGGNFGRKIVFSKDQIIPFKYFNPKNPYRGRGSIQAGAMAIDINDFSQEWNRSFFFNGATPGLVFTTDQKMNKQVLDRFMESWNSQFQGRKNAHKIAFLSGGFKMDKTSTVAKELDFVEQRRIMRDDMLATFRVPKTILGLTDEVNYANANATTRAYMERVVTPRMIKFAGQLNEFYLPKFKNTENLFFDFTDPAPEDVELKLKKYANARQNNWMTPNEIREEENLEPVEGGDELFTQNTFGQPMNEEENKLFARIKSIFTRQQASKPKEKPKKPFKHMMRIPSKKPDVIKREEFKAELTEKVQSFVSYMLQNKNIKDEPEETEAEGSGWSEEKKAEKWKVFAETTKQKEKQLIRMMKDQFDWEESEVFKNLEQVKYWKKELRKGKESSVLPSWDEMISNWKSMLIPYVREIVLESGNEALDEVGIGGDLNITSDQSVEFLRQHGAELVKEITGTTREKLRTTLSEGFEKGEGIDKLKNRVEDVFEEARGSRSVNIARTEVIRASNFGTNEGYRQSSVVVKKEWLSERDNRTCPWCQSVDGKVVGTEEVFFKEGETLTVDDQKLNIKLLDVGYPPLHPQCRCTIIPVVE